MLGHLVFIGHISMDHVVNINGEREQPGGAALYAAMAARTLFPDVRIVSAIGQDYKYTEILNLFKYKEIKVVNTPSTSFTIRYDENWKAQYIKANIGAGAQIKSNSIPINWITSKATIHICPMRPLKVEKIIDRIRKISPKTMISVNTWEGYMDTKVEREVLKRIASKVDVFILNEGEIKKLTQTNSLSLAITLLKCKLLVVTLGSLGAIISSNNTVTMIPALSTIGEKVIDTTGAGDCWCGAFLATYKLTEDISKAITVASIISSIKCMGWGFEKLVNLKFTKPEDIVRYIINLREKGVQRSITEFIKTEPSH